jgi:putative signal transduction protein with nacht domain
MAKNSLIFYDMSGNVWEWCYDWYNIEQTARINRGGGAISKADFCKVSENGSNFPLVKDPYIGFRLVRSIR